MVPEALPPPVRHVHALDELDPTFVVSRKTWENQKIYLFETVTLERVKVVDDVAGHNLLFEHINL